MGRSMTLIKRTLASHFLHFITLILFCLFLDSVPAGYHYPASYASWHVYQSCSKRD